MALAVSWRYCLALFIVAMGSSFQFYSFAVVNPAQTVVETWINNTYAKRDHVALTRRALTLYWSVTVSAIAVGAFLGSLITRTLAEKCGRRNALILNGVISVLGGLCAGAAKYAGSPELLVIGRLISGVSIGVGSGVAPMYMMEISPVEYRGAAGTVHMIAVAFGDWFSLVLGLPSVLGSKELWPVAFGFAAIPAVFLVVLLPCFPKSPRYTLISLGRREEAKRAIEAFTSKRFAKKAFEDLVREAAIGQNVGAFQVSQLFRTKHLRMPMLLSIMVMVAQQFTGVAALFSFSTNIFLQGNLSMEAAHMATVSLGVVYFICALPSPLLIEKQGRRFLSLFQLSGCVFCLVVLSLLIGIQTHMHAGPWASYGCIGILLLYFAFYGVGSPIPWMITGELFAQEHRSAAVSLSTFVSWFLAFAVSVAYLPFAELVGVELSFLPFIVVLCLSIAWLALLLPETRNRTISQIVGEFKERARTLSVVVTHPRQSLSAFVHSGHAEHPELQRLLEDEDDDTEANSPSASASSLQPEGETNYGAVERSPN